MSYITPELYVLRHGQTDYNLKKVVQGAGIDSILNETGLGQANAFFEQYKNEEFDAIYSSQLQRTYQTVRPFEQKKYEIRQVEALNEMNWGIHEGKRPDGEMNKSYRIVTGAWRAGDFSRSVEEGQSPLEIQLLLKDFFINLHQLKYNKILLCSHGRTSRILLCTLLNRSLSEMRTFRHGNTGLYKLQAVDGSYELTLENDLSHLEISN